MVKLKNKKMIITIVKQDYSEKGLEKVNEAFTEETEEERKLKRIIYGEDNDTEEKIIELEEEDFENYLVKGCLNREDFSYAEESEEGSIIFTKSGKAIEVKENIEYFEKFV